MLFSPLVWAIFAFTLLVSIPGALASPSPKRSKKQASTRVTVETYPAIEGDEPEELEISTPTKVKPLAAKLPSIGSTAPVGTPLSRREPIRKSSGSVQKFEVVPAEKREQILKRMQLCQSLFMESGRAYDYRLMTTRELEAELNKLRLAKGPAPREVVIEKDPILNPDLSPEVE